MGGGSWTTHEFTAYAKRAYGASVSDSGVIANNLTNQEIFKQKHLSKLLDPCNVMRECCDSEEHPNTKPVILALDVTGSMGQAAVEVAKSLNKIMADLYESIEDVEFCVMGIGDLYCDMTPIQISQFESDIRIMESLDKVYFEFGGGGNLWESYTAAWYMGSRHTKLDCNSRGEKGIIITIGDEMINPTLSKEALQKATGDSLQADVETDALYAEATEKFDLWHIHVNHRSYGTPGLKESWSLLGDHYVEGTLEEIPQIISGIIAQKYANGSPNGDEGVNTDTSVISW